MKLLQNSIPVPNLDRVRVARQKANGLSQTMDVIIEKGYDTVDEDFIVVERSKHRFSGQDYQDILQAADPELEIYNKLNITVQ